MFDEKERATGVGGLTVEDVWIGLQLLEKAMKHGVITGRELSVMSNWRNNLTDSVRRSVGKDYDEVQAQFLREQQLAAQRQAQQAQQAQQEQPQSVEQEDAPATDETQESA